MTCPGGATVLIPAHGVAPGVRDEAAERGLNVIDATCPLVAGVQAEARRFAERGDQVVLIGQSGLAVLPAILGEAPDHAILAETRVGAGAVQVADPRRVSYVLVPGVPVEDTADRDRGPAVPVPGPARPGPGRVLLRRVRPGRDRPDRGRVQRPGPGAGHRGRPRHPAT